MLAYLRTQPVKLTVTSTATAWLFWKTRIARLHDIEFSVDYQLKPSRMHSAVPATGRSFTSRQSVVWTGRARDYYRRNDEGELLASGGCWRE